MYFCLYYFPFFYYDVYMQSSEICSETTSKDGTRRGRNKNSIDNLKPFVKGVSGNPSGKIKGTRNYSTLMDLAIESTTINYVNKYNRRHKKNKIELEDVDIEQDIFIQLIDKARNGDIKAMQIFFDRVYGKPRLMPSYTSTQDDNFSENELKTEEEKKQIEDFFRKWGL